jgi:rhodanese-related sulfurtransferase
MWFKIAFAGVVLLVPLWEIVWYLLGVRHIYPWQIKHLPQRERPFTIDVRTPQEFTLLHIPRSINRPDLILHNKRLPFAAEEPLLVTCMTGHRSPFVVRKLKKMGYKEVYNLAWGIVGWKIFGDGTVSGPPSEEE